VAVQARLPDERHPDGGILEGLPESLAVSRPVLQIQTAFDVRSAGENLASHDPGEEHFVRTERWNRGDYGASARREASPHHIFAKDAFLSEKKTRKKLPVSLQIILEFFPRSFGDGLSVFKLRVTKGERIGETTQGGKALVSQLFADGWNDAQGAVGPEGKGDVRSPKRRAGDLAGSP